VVAESGSVPISLQSPIDGWLSAGKALNFGTWILPTSCWGGTCEEGRAEKLARVWWKPGAYCFTHKYLWSMSQWVRMMLDTSDIKTESHSLCSRGGFLTVKGSKALGERPSPCSTCTSEKGSWEGGVIHGLPVKRWAGVCQVIKGWREQCLRQEVPCEHRQGCRRD
jgi:hypothetical protein